MIRAAAKNYRDVAVVVDPGDYPLVEKAVSSGAFTGHRADNACKKSLFTHCRI